MSKDRSLGQEELIIGVRGRKEKSVQRITDWHHEACRVMINGDPEGRVFLSYRHTNNGFYFLPTTAFFPKLSEVL